MTYRARLSRQGRVLRANLVWILGIASAGSLLVLAVMLLRPAVYESSALLEVAEAGEGALHHSHAAPAQIIRSRAVLEPAADSLRLNNRSGFSGKDVIASLRGALRVEIQAETPLLRIAFRSSDPALARAGVQAVTHSYIAFNETQQISRIEDSADLLLRALDKVFDMAPQWLEPGLHSGELGPEIGSARSMTPALLYPVQNSYPNFSGVTSLRGLIEEAVVRSAVSNYENSLRRITRVTVIDAADLPRHALPRLHFSWLVTGFLLSALLCCSWLLFRVGKRNTVAFADEATTAIGLPVLASLPRGNPLSDREYAEALRTLRTLFVNATSQVVDSQPFSGFARKAQIILVTSASPDAISAAGTAAAGERPSTELATNLALSLGQVERVLLINTDMRSAGPESFCGIGRGAAGLSHLIAGAAQLRDCIHTQKEEGIDVMPAGVLPPNPQELLSSKRFRRILDVLEKRYDYLILDAMAMGSAADALLLARHSTDTLLTITAGLTPVPAAKRAAQMLQRVSGKSPKLILTQVDTALARKLGLEREQSPATDLTYAYSKPGGSYLAGGQA